MVDNTKGTRPATTVVFEFKNETKGAIRYTEVTSGDNGDPLANREAKIGTLYLRKSALREMGFTHVPSTLAVSVESRGAAVPADVVRSTRKVADA